MRPTTNALILLLGCFVFALFAAFFPGVLPLAVGGVLLSALILGIDGIFGFFPPVFWGGREISAQLFLGVRSSVTLTLRHAGKGTRKVRVFDDYPSALRCEAFPLQARLEARQNATLQYTVTPEQRGEHHFEKIYLEIQSPLGLWWRTRQLEESKTVRVYPNYQPILSGALLTTTQRWAQLGLRQSKQAGMSKEFRQLRDYREGDGLSSIDWKATSRVNRLISRETEKERDQHLLIVVDTSIRTKAIDGKNALLDHLLNTTILLSHLALARGDQVSVMNFGGEPRSLKKVRGKRGLEQIVHHLYDYTSHPNYGEYEDLRAQITALGLKRSLVVVLTNQRSEEHGSLLHSFKQLSAKHLVILASIKERTIESIANQELLTAQDEAAYLGALAYEQDIALANTDLERHQIHVLRTEMEQFSSSLSKLFLALRGTL